MSGGRHTTIPPHPHSQVLDGNKPGTKMVATLLWSLNRAMADVKRSPIAPPPRPAAAATAVNPRMMILPPTMASPNQRPRRIRFTNLRLLPLRPPGKRLYAFPDLGRPSVIKLRRFPDLSSFSRKDGPIRWLPRLLQPPGRTTVLLGRSTRSTRPTSNCMTSPSKR